jgi:hypothetical protein
MMQRVAQAMRLRAPALTPGVEDWVRDHDEKWLFVALYLGLSVGLSIFISLFWLVVVVAAHFTLELYRQSSRRATRRDVALHAMWEVKLDVGLVILAFTLVLYIDVVLGVLGVQAASRAAAATRATARIGARAAAWERNVRTFLLTVDEMARITHAAALYRRGKRGGGSVHESADGQVDPGSPVGGEGETDAAGAGGSGGGAAPGPAPAVAAATTRPAPAWRGTWGWGDRIGLGLVGGGTLLMLLAPVITPHDVGSAVATLLEQLRPFPPS